MKFITDLHLHSKYSRAVSQEMVLSKMAEWAKLKGISVMGTADFTHPFWLEHLKNELEEAGNGLYRLGTTTTDRRLQTKAVDSGQSTVDEVYFLLSTEISSIYNQGGKTRRIHNLFFFPSLASVDKFGKQLFKRGANLRADGRPIVGISSRDLAEIALECDDKALIIPAHAWTPWFSVFGSFSGFDSLSECFTDMTGYIYAVETGLSSDPAMNWRIKDLDNRAIVSFSDAHSLEKIGREATVFEADEVGYDSIYCAIAGPAKENSKLNRSPSTGVTRDKIASSPKIAFTIEFYPEEGKYHFTGHRDCNFSQSPEETAKKGDICPVCGRGLTIGVMHRVEDLAKREEKTKIQMINGVKWIYPDDSSRPPYVSLVPLSEIIAEAFSVGVNTQKVQDLYLALASTLGGEFSVLFEANLSEIAKISGAKVAEGIGKVRKGDVVVEPGYDGKFGIVKIWQDVTVGEGKKEDVEKKEDAQLNLFA